MNKLNINKGALAIMAIGMLLVSGCEEDDKKEEDTTKINYIKSDTSCKHLIIYFAEEPVIYKECEGYEITNTIGQGNCRYIISEKSNHNTIASGSTSNYNIYYSTHNDSQLNDLEDDIITNGGRVYTLNK